MARFGLDRSNGKLWGVCAGIARATGIDATIVRVALVLLTLLGGFPWTLLAYAGAGWIGKRGEAPSRLSTADLREMQASDRRLAEIEAQVASTDGRLAREIEALR